MKEIDCNKDNYDRVAQLEKSIDEAHRRELSMMRKWVSKCIDYQNLAAECAALRKFIDQSCYAYDGDGSDISDSYVPANESILFPKNPATAAALVEFHAQGVELLAEKLWTTAYEHLANSDIEPANQCKAIIKYAEHFAAELRAGKDGE